MIRDSQMKSIPLKPDTDLSPLPFEPSLCEFAQVLKKRGLPWNPHVGCFVWDPEGTIPVPSPFPNRIYFVLNLNHFLKIFNDIENMKKKLVWIPTWHQCRLIAQNLGIKHQELTDILQNTYLSQPGEELKIIYQLIIDHLDRK
jgi:hypothetical protein